MIPFDRFVERELRRLRAVRRPVNPLTDVLERRLPNQLCETGALWLEFGVGGGSTMNEIARCHCRRVYGFDSFGGLPEDWRPGFGKGTFAMRELPVLESNVELVTGHFNDSVGPFLEMHAGVAALVHIDCDLFSSSFSVLSALAERRRLVDGSIVVFDEFHNYPGFEDHELRAWYEIQREYGLNYDWIVSRGVGDGQAAALRIW